MLQRMERQNLGIAAEDRKEKQLSDEIARLKVRAGGQDAGNRFFSKCLAQNRLAQNQGERPAEYRVWRLMLGTIWWALRTILFACSYKSSYCVG
jgi:hypothetical protein